MKSHNLFWGSIFILAGALFLLNNLGILNINVWGLVWPFLLIASGLWILWSATLGRTPFESEEVEIPLEGAKRAELRIQFGAGRIKVNGGADQDTLLRGSFLGGLDYQTQRRGDSLHIDMQPPSLLHSPLVLGFPWSPGAREWALDLHTETPLILDVDCGASDLQMDLSDVLVHKLKLDTGASSSSVTLPARAGHTQVDIDCGAASVDLQIPEGVGAYIRVDGALSTTDIDRDRFPRVSDAYQSENYLTAANKVDIHVDIGAGTISIR